jgi:hypothetical protein
VNALDQFSVQLRNKSASLCSVMTVKTRSLFRDIFDDFGAPVSAIA